jgi:hypothetical protein
MKFPSTLPNGHAIPKLPQTAQPEKRLSESQRIRKEQNDNYARALAEVQAEEFEAANPQQSVDNYRETVAQRYEGLGPEPEVGITLALQISPENRIFRTFGPSTTIEDLYYWAAFHSDRPPEHIELGTPTGILPRDGTLADQLLTNRTLVQVRITV